MDEANLWLHSGLSRLRDDESKVAGWVADLSEFDPLIDPALTGEFEVKLKDGSTHTGRPAWDLWAEYLQQFTPERVSEITGVDAKLIEDAVVDWATRDDPRIPNGRHQLRFGAWSMQQLDPKLPRHHGGLRDGGRYRHAGWPTRRDERVD